MMWHDSDLFIRLKDGPEYFIVKRDGPCSTEFVLMIMIADNVPLHETCVPSIQSCSSFSMLLCVIADMQLHIILRIFSFMCGLEP